jgi:predicted nuclease of predicted toxin-antitoxin system
VIFLIDAQLPPALARELNAAGHVALHVADAGLLYADDSTIWRHAIDIGATIITKDEDFAARWARGDRAAAIVWLRVGNTSRTALLTWFMPQMPHVVALLASGERLIELR